MRFCENCGTVLPIGTGSPLPNICLTCYETISPETDKDRYLFQALAEYDGFDDAIIAEQFYDFILAEYGSCPYTLEEVKDWLNEDGSEVSA